MPTRTDQPAQPRPGGRPRDPERDTALLAAVCEILPEVGYDRLTVDAVAARAGASRATVYRRWKDKSELVRSALEALGWEVPVPDTGDLRSDLLALGAAYTDRSSQRDGVLAAIAAAASRDPQLREVAHEAIAKPRRAAFEAVVERARQRGEIADGVDLTMIGTVVPAMIFHRILILGEPTDGAFFEQMIDALLIPLLTR
ncbi:TetR/AcrR family transcriptional regulator [Nocardia huaxiensis]|uniref:TetR/AcrR family transcriptional regulator n=1 Tax=Nocardia huaxiensis TaxID=2755382 RepID=A0A7D6VFX6_9NOCA|nr:TetR/AcrR family transcriptional regulator [Nocardia huaxiensis]QLY28710.1 TetR/AcrR family transcriptional regulator [Nocardia huaxiensis]UFS97814.1 TetR/AcrR family transcriptional regulator [Nocardia huaxiensis]